MTKAQVVDAPGSSVAAAHLVTAFSASSARAGLQPMVDEANDIVGTFAASLLAAEASSAAELIDRLQRRGLSVDTICCGLCEPVARRLGDWWNQDLCAESDITIAICRLQSLMRELRVPLPVAQAAVAQPRAVLVASQPGEMHLLRLALDLEYFCRAGWEIDCEFPRDDEALCRLLHDKWFDVLTLSLSSVFMREHRLLALASSIQASRNASRNPALAVMVDGRIFFEHTEYCVLVGADAVCASVDRVATVAESLVNAMQQPAFVAAQNALTAVGRRVASRALTNSRRRTAAAAH